MSNIFTSKPKIKVGQNSISFVSQNGLEYQPGQKIVVEIDESLAFFDPQQSYLKFDLLIDTNSPEYNYLVQLDPLIGASVLLEDVRCFNRAGVLLEEYPNYYTWANVQTLYSETETRINKDGLTEGVVAYNPDQRSWVGGNNSRFQNTQFNPYFRKDTDGAVTYNKVRICLKLKTGIMSSKTIVPNRLMGGMRWEFILSPVQKVFKLFRNATNPDHCPKLSHVGGGAAWSGYPTASSPTTQLYLSYANNQLVDPDRVPFCVGERITIDGITPKTTIEKIELDGAFIKLTVASLVNTDGDIDSGAFIQSTSFADQTKTPSYTVSNVEMIMEEILTTPAYSNQMMSALKENGKVAYNCICAQNYRHSVLATDLNATVHLNLSNSMAKSILVVPVTDQTADLATNIEQYNGFRNAISGTWDHLKNYQWQYDSKLQPDRAVSTEKTAKTLEVYDGQYLTELEKSVIMAGIPSNSFEHIKHNCIIPRALALEGQIYDTRGKDFQINLNYGASASKAKLLNCWLVHVRRFEITTSGVNVIF